MTRRRLVLYLLLNALISVLVSGTILFYYDRANHKTDCGTIETVPTLASGGVKADIVSVTGAGMLTSESVAIQNNGDAALLLAGWKLKDGQGSTYTFPQLTLYPGGTVQVHTGPGTDTAADLYWQLSAPVWISGELVALYDTQNIARTFYRVP
ncbi:MAG TPA: lamin tail domain-containing protein [Anaerolineales bacterium]